MAPNISIKYFDIRGRAEPTRLALILGDIPFEDDRFSFPEWKDVRPTTPFGSVPVATIDGEVFTQSTALLRYAGKLSGLYPTDPKDALRVDMVMDTLSDLTQLFFAYRGPDKEQLKAARTKALEEGIPRYWIVLNDIVTKWGDGPFILGDKVSVADLTLLELMSNIKQGKLDFVPTDAMDGGKRLAAVWDAVMALPKVAEWYQKHPIKGVTDTE